MPAAGAPIKIAGILLEKGRQDRATEESADRRVSVGSSVALRISLGALSISTEIILRLLNSRDDTVHTKSDGVQSALPGKLELLLRAERERIVDVGDIEIGHEAEDALFFLV